MIDLDDAGRDDALLFGESQSRIVVTCRKANLSRLLETAAARGVPAKAIGRAGGADIAIRRSGRELLRVPVEKAFRVWKDSLPGFFKVRT
jgi:phosphoribosylformylglycinamidine synthase